MFPVVVSRHLHHPEEAESISITVFANFRNVPYSLAGALKDELRLRDLIGLQRYELRAA
jgi:hypothetical protein